LSFTQKTLGTHRVDPSSNVWLFNHTDAARKAALALLTDETRRRHTTSAHTAILIGLIFVAAAALSQVDWLSALIDRLLAIT
jgi:hypothetical protein